MNVYSCDPFSLCYHSLYFLSLFLVGCCFVQQRFRILRLPIIFNDESKVDNVFIATAILHNMILQYDGHHNRWKLDDNWISSAGAHGDEEVEQLRRRMHLRDSDYSFVHTPNLPDYTSSSQRHNWLVLRVALMNYVFERHVKRELFWLRPIAANRSKYSLDATEILSRRPP